MPKNSASALPRSCRGNVWTTIASAAGNMIAPPAPWTARNVTSHASARLPFGVSPHSAEAPAKTITPSTTIFVWPTRVGQPAAEGEERREREQVGVDRPLDAGAGQPELPLDVGRRDRHDRLVDERHRHGEDHRGENQVSRTAATGRDCHRDQRFWTKRAAHVNSSHRRPLADHQPPRLPCCGAPLPRHDVRLPDERPRFRADQGHARGARARRGADAPTRPTSSSSTPARSARSPTRSSPPISAKRPRGSASIPTA